jgi:hypothetical protein
LEDERNNDRNQKNNNHVSNKEGTNESDQEKHYNSDCIVDVD